MPPSTFPAGLDADLAKLWFGHAKNNGREFRFDQNGPVSKLWLGLGRFPTLVWTDDFDTRTYFRFSDGTVIWRPDAQESYRVLQLPHRALGLNPAGNLSFPVGMDGDLAKLWFGQAENDGQTFGFNNDDEVSKRWLVSGRFPSLDWTNDFGSRTYFRFTDGTVIWRPDAQSEYRVLGVALDGGTFAEGMDADLAKLWFGRAENNGQEFAFDQNDAVGQLWLKLRRFPSLVWTNDFDSRTYFRFADGTVIWRPDAESEFRVLGSVSVATSISAIWGGGERTINQEFRNLTGPDFYDYGRQYCLNGVEHTGIDVGLSIGDTLFAPVDGEITCAGTGIGPGTDNQGCAAFADTGNCCPSPGHPCSSVGAGRIELKIDDNTVLILGHSRTCLKQPGDRVVAGEPIGTVGGMCGPHTHIEVRVRDENCTIGWRIVDPRDVLGR